jgi:hypothetical protein
MDRTIRLREKGKVKRPTRAAVVSALILWLNDQSTEKQKEIVAQGMGKLNALLAGEPPAPDSVPAIPPVVNETRVYRTGQEKPKRRRTGTN